MTKGKKIAIIAVSAVICAIIIAVVTLSIVQSTFYSPSLCGVNSLNIYIDGRQLSVGECTDANEFPPAEGDEPTKGQKIFAGVMEANKTSSNESVLTCIFAGTYSFEAGWKAVDTDLSTIKGTGYVVEYKFKEEQTLVINGEEQKDEDNNLIKYNSMFVQVNDTNDLTETVAYLCKNNNTKSKFKVSFLARQTVLYDYITEIAEA